MINNDKKNIKNDYDFIHIWLDYVKTVCFTLIFN